ncbi:hypothetical protein [Bosea sp. MMO-172]|uniref:hypothetical protein n=1 Tax=Bosea sp. MMO-172 TaxID=3127885 RepID=UPI0030168BD6
MIAQKAVYYSMMLDCFSDLVRANRIGCDNDLPREVHDNVLALLTELRADLQDYLAFESRALCETDPELREDLAWQLRRRQRGIDSYWYEISPFSLGGWHRVGRDGCFVNPVTGCRGQLGDDMLFLPIPKERLCGLPSLLPAIVKESCLGFASEIVFYRVKQAPARLNGRPQSLDLDAEIPW